MSELRRLSAGTSFTKDSLDHFFDSLSGAVWNDIGLLGFLREGDRVAEFRRNGREVPTQLYGNVGLIGSGRWVIAWGAWRAGRPQVPGPCGAPPDTGRGGR